MLILHGAWFPASSSEESSSFRFWGEPQSNTTKKEHTSLEVEEIQDMMNHVVGRDVAFTFLKEKGKVSLLHSFTEELISVSIQAEYGKISDLLEVLTMLDHPKLLDSWGYTLGESLLLWSQSARMCLELVDSGHFIPTINQSGTAGFWDAVLDDPRIDHQIISLTKQTKYPQEYIDHFIKTCVDLFVRESMDESEVLHLMKSMNSRYIAPLTPSEHWLQSLFAQPNTNMGDPAVEWIADEIIDWRSTIVNRQNESSFRTCFRLEQPAASNQPTEESIWILRILLQATDDPSLLVPAEFVWSETSETLKYLNYRFHQPQERLLSDLGKAGRLFEPIMRSLQASNPTQCEMNTKEAHQFLKQAAELLRSNGFGLFIPSWWQKSQNQLGVKMKLNSSTNSNLANETSDRRGSFKANRIGFDAIMDYEWQLALGDEQVSREDFEQLAALKQPLVQVRGQWIEFQPQYMDEAIRMLNDKGTIKLSEAMHIALNVMDEEDAPINKSKLPVNAVTASGSVGYIMDQLRQVNHIEFLDQPDELQGILRPYQLKGFSWLVFMRELELGACLADDMGLGKTVQWITYLLHLKHQNKLNGTALLICPTSVIGNWQKELERFAPDFKVWVHYGPDRLKGTALAETAASYDIVLTSYAVTMRDEVELLPIEWDTVTLDEAQNIKNTGTKQAKAIRKLKAYHRMALTGTPVENRLTELWSIMDFLNPGYLGSKDQFIQQFEAPIERNEDSNTVQTLQRIVQPFVLRRLKSDRKVIDDIPDKQETKDYCSLTREQATLYEACVKSAFQKMEKASGMERRGTILATLTHLKQICNHPAHYLGEGNLEENRSGKLIRLVEMLQGLMARGERALVFTQYARFAGLLQQFLTQRFQQEVLLIHGRVPKKKRDEMIARFQEDPDAPSIFVLSLKTGGFGLNLTSANHVIHYDRWWNPAVENQATDRAYRIGQQRNVEVHKFLCSGTLEEKIDRMIESKQTLATRVIGKGEAWITEMSTDDLKQIFMLQNEVMI